MGPTIVAHRGDAERYPENTLPAIESAWRGGLRDVEIDVQLSADLVPFVIHDATLERTTRGTGDVRALPASALDAVDAGEPARFGDAHAGTRLPRLADAVALMARHDGAHAFVEVKRASLQRHGHETCMDRVLEALGPVAGRCTVISFDLDACRIARERAGFPIGWVLDRNVDEAGATLESLRPEFAFFDHRRLAPGAALPPGPWTWVAYEVTDAALARALAARGAAMVESMAPFRLGAELASARVTA